MMQILASMEERDEFQGNEDNEAVSEAENRKYESLHIAVAGSEPEEGSVDKPTSTQVSDPELKIF